MTGHQNFTATARAPAQVAVDRAIADLRRGAIVALRDQHRDTLAVVAAAELLGATRIADLTRLAGSAAVLAVTGPRAHALGLAESAGPARTIALTREIDEDMVCRLADPSLAPTDTAPLDIGGLTVLPAIGAGPAERALELMKLAGLLPAAVVALVAPIAPMTAERWAAAHSLLLVDVDAVASYRARVAARLTRAAAAHVPLADAEDCEVVAFRPLDGGSEHLALVIGAVDRAAPVLARVHSQCLTGDLLGSLRCDCGDQLRGAIREINAAGGGILLYLAQEGRNIGLLNKLRAYALQDGGLDTIDANLALGFEADERVYQPAAEMLRQLGVTAVRLMTNNPEKVAQLQACGITAGDRVAHVFPSKPITRLCIATSGGARRPLFMNGDQAPA